LREQPGREVDTFDAREAEALESDQAVSAAAKKLDNLGIAGPLASAQAIEPGNKLLNFLFRRFETEIGGFPGIRGQGDLCRRLGFVS